MSDVRLGELAPAVVSAAAEGDAVARGLVERLADEIALMVRRAIADLGVSTVDVVLGGGMLADGRGPLYDLIVAALPSGARPLVPVLPPVAGAVLAALDAVDAPAAAGERVRAAFGASIVPDDVRGTQWSRPGA
jgi:N-acetylglucosamine kinase-like BadF-type ATPase